MWGLRNRINTHRKEKQFHRHREQTDGCPMGEEWGGVRKGKGVRSTDWQVQNKPQGRKFQRREDSH